MKSITILGCGLSGIAFARKAREANADIKITLVDKSTVSFDRWQFFNDLSFKNRIDLAALAKDLKAEFICDTVERINPKRHKVYFKDKECRDFEVLVLATGAVSKKIPAKGEHREGFFYLSSIDLLLLRDRLKMSDDVAVYVSTVLGVKIALNIKAMGKDVSIISKSLDFLGSRKDDILAYCQRAGIAVYNGYTIEEAIGEATVKAVRLSPLKIVSAQILLLDTGFMPNADF